MALSISLVGSRGRMGQTIAAVAKERGIAVAAQVDLGDDLALAFAAGDVVADFSFHSVTEKVIARAASARKPLIIGTTGHSSEGKETLVGNCRHGSALRMGRQLFGRSESTARPLARRASRVLGPDYDAEVVEMHHRF